MPEIIYGVSSTYPLHDTLPNKLKCVCCTAGPPRGRPGKSPGPSRGAEGSAAGGQGGVSGRGEAVATKGLRVSRGLPPVLGGSRWGSPFIQQ